MIRISLGGYFSFESVCVLIVAFSVNEVKIDSLYVYIGDYYDFFLLIDRTSV